MLKEIKKNELFQITSPHSYVLGTVLDKDGKPTAMGISWWTFTSWEPLMVAFSIGRNKHTHDCLEHGREFVLNFPSLEQAAGAWLCGTTSGRMVDKFQKGGFETLAAKKVDVPLMAGCSAAIEVRILQRIETGDHTLFIGNAVALHGDTDKPFHLYAKAYRELYALDPDGKLKPAEYLK